LPDHFAAADLAAFMHAFIKHLTERRWHPAVVAEIVNSAIAPLLTVAAAKGTLDNVLPTPLLDSILETLTSVPDPNMAYHLMSEVCLLCVVRGNSRSRCS
jgi:hypothetical protein